MDNCYNSVFVLYLLSIKKIYFRPSAMYWCCVVISSEIKHCLLEIGERLIRFKKLRKLKGSGTKKLQDSQKSSSRFKSNRKFQERRASSAELSARYTARSRWTCSVVCESSLMLGAGPSVFQLPLCHQHRSKFIGLLSWTRAELFLQSVIPAPPRGSRHFFKPSKEKKNKSHNNWV